MTPPPWLLIAVGNPSRGDDALGPLLLEWLQRERVDAAGDVELLTDFQLQVEHALDLRGRRGVLFVDAARPGVVQRATLAPIAAAAPRAPASHAMRPEAVLHVAQRLDGCAPASWLLAIEGRSFELGGALSGPAAAHLADAKRLALAWIAQRRCAAAARPAAA